VTVFKCFDFRNNRVTNAALNRIGDTPVKSHLLNNSALSVRRRVAWSGPRES